MIYKETKYYPIPYSGLSGLLVSLCFGLFIGFFLWFFKPFNIGSFDYSILEFFFFGFITFAVFLVAHCILPLVYQNIYDEKVWTIYAQIIFYITAFYYCNIQWTLGVSAVNTKIEDLIIDEGNGIVWGRMTINYTSNKSGKVRIEEAFIQKWSNDKIYFQRFFYGKFLKQE